MKTTDSDGHTALAFALKHLLEKQGWNLLVVGDVKVQKPLTSRKYNYEAVISFTGTKPRGKK